VSRRVTYWFVGPRLRAVGVIVAVLAGVAIFAGAAAVPGGAVAATPDQTINAQADPDAAAQALSANCSPISNCSLHSVTPITLVHGPPSIVGDVLYNCNPPGGPNAYTAVGMSDTRAETTSISEKLSVTLQGGLIGLASTSLEAWVSSTQAQTFSTTVTTGTQVMVPPGYEGYTTSEVLSAQTNGTYYVTQGIHLIAVTNVLLTFPGYEIGDRNDRVVTSTYSVPINPTIGQSYETSPPCNAVNPVTGLGGARRNVSPGSFKNTFCPDGKDCVAHTIAGPPPSPVRQATVALTRAGQTYATGTDNRGRIRLDGRRRLPAGKYKLIIRQKPRETVVRQHGQRIRAARQQVEIHIPINVCGNSASSPAAGLQPHFGNNCTNG
jgi:hypothetical protein